MVILIAFEILQEGAEGAREAVQLGSGGLVGGRKVDHGGVAASVLADVLAEERNVFEGRKGEGGVDGLGVEGEPFPMLQPSERGKQGRYQGKVGRGVFAGDGSGEEG